MISQIKFSLIVAMDDDSLIGIKEYDEYSIPWTAPKGDIDFFRRKTTETTYNTQINVIVIGYNTWLSLPSIYKKNTKRKNIIISGSVSNKIIGTEKYVESFEQALNFASELDNVNNIFIIGGGAIYDIALRHPLLETIYLTHIKHSYPKNNIIEYGIYFPLSHFDLSDFTKNNSLSLISDTDLIDINKDISYCLKQYSVNNTFHKSYQQIKKIPRQIKYNNNTLIQVNNNDGEYQYLNLIRNILQNGILKSTRNGLTKSIFGYQLKYDLTDGYPVSTIKKSYPKTIFEELMWIIRGQTDVKKLQEKNVHVWDKNSTKEFLLKNNLPYEENDIGPGYGFQMRHFGAKYTDCLGNYMNEGVDQLLECINLINNDPQSRRIIINLWNCKDINKMALPPCFLAGTLVLTDEGYIKIENVKKTNLLLSHLGNMREIKKIYRTLYFGKIYKIGTDFHPFLINTTPAHPLYVKKNILSDPEWIQADNINLFNFIGCPINQQKIIPNFNSIKKQLSLDNSEYWFMFGYYICCGSLDLSNKHKFYFVFNKNNMINAYPKISTIISLQKIKSISTKYDIFESKSFEWWNLLKSFESLPNQKIIPEWVHNAPKKLILKFVEGYTMLDSDTINVSTTSPHIAFGLQRLLLKLNKVVKIKYQKNIYQIIEERNNKYYHFDKNYIWFKISNITVKNIINEYVYNFDVKKDHSYIVENITTHNCHVMYNFGIDLYVEPNISKNRGRLNCHLLQRSWDVMLGWNTTTAALLTYMLAHHCDLDPGILIHSITDAHLYKIHIDSGAINKLLQRIPRKLPTLKFIKKRNNIEDYIFEDIVIKNYYPCPSIPVELVA